MMLFIMLDPPRQCLAVLWPGIRTPFPTFNCKTNIIYHHEFFTTEYQLWFLGVWDRGADP